MSEPRYAVGELADLGEVSRRTVRFYVQEGLLPPPYGVGRGNHYGPEHLDRLRRVRAMQEAGRTLEEIRAAFTSPHSAEPAPAPSVPRTLWRHIDLGPGVQLQVAHDVRLPSPARLRELAGWCRQHFIRDQESSEDEHA
jgi:DNA-binding transcriptional MerR regulator